MAALNAQGTTIAFGTSSFTAQVLEITPPSVSRDSKDTTHLGTTTARTNEPAKLVTPGVMRLRIRHDPDEQPPYKGPAETITITYPVKSGDTNGATLAFSGWVSSYQPGGAMVDELMEAELEVQMSGDITFTDGS